MVGLLSPTKES